jgi:hypothetical protein
MVHLFNLFFSLFVWFCRFGRLFVVFNHGSPETVGGPLFANSNRALWLERTNTSMLNVQNSSNLLKILFSGAELKCKPNVKGLELRRLRGLISP